MTITISHPEGESHTYQIEDLRQGCIYLGPKSQIDWLSKQIQLDALRGELATLFQSKRPLASDTVASEYASAWTRDRYDVDTAALSEDHTIQIQISAKNDESDQRSITFQPKFNQDTSITNAFLEVD
jgi:hypothetical protein